MSAVRQRATLVQLLLLNWYERYKIYFTSLEIIDRNMTIQSTHYDVIIGRNIEASFLRAIGDK